MTDAESIAADFAADGQPMVLTRVTQGEYDPVSGTTSDDLTQSWDVYGVTKSYRDGAANMPGTTILAGDKKALIAALDFAGTPITPTPGDTLSIGGVTWQVIAVDTLSPQGEDLMHTCQVRK